MQKYVQICDRSDSSSSSILLQYDIRGHAGERIEAKEVHQEIEKVEIAGDLPAIG